MSRAERSAKRRQDWHEGRIAVAPTPKGRLWAACAWLVSEAWRANRLDEITEWVLTRVHELREEVACGRY